MRLPARCLTAGAAIIAGLASTGCVERTITITSEPSGALVTLGDNEVGRTPLTTGFKYHGTYDVLVTLEGYEPLRTTATAEAPIYEYPGPDLVAEVLPFTFRNEQAWHFVLEPRLESTLSQAQLEEGMLERASEMRALLDATEPPPPPKRPWLDGSLDEEAVPEQQSPAASAPALPGTPADERPIEEPADQPDEQPNEQQSSPPAAPMGTMMPVPSPAR